MPEIMQARQFANRLSELISTLESDARWLGDDGWHVSSQQIRNAVNLLHDVERRLRNGDDWNG